MTAAGLRVGLTAPFAHPYVYRGVERVVSELAEWLSGRGHTVTVVTSAPDGDRDAAGPGGSTVRYRRAGPARGRGRLRIDEVLATAPAIARGVRGLDLDVVQHHHPADAIGTWFGSLGGPAPSILWVSGVPRRANMGGRPLSRLAATVALRRADRVHVLSDYAARALREEFGRDGIVVPPGVRTDDYAGERASTGPPVVLCAAAADDRRKRVELLLRAWPLVRAQRPDALLVLAQPRAEAAQRLLAGMPADDRAGVEVRTTAFADIPRLYRESSVSVLPSLDEGFGLVVVESLAAGTPVVATDHGALPEILDDEGVGRLFDPFDERHLARRLLEALELTEDPSTAERCRKHARRWDWDVVGPVHESAYRALAERGASS